jgi:uncharacterized glyoxalase superfamily protein PhnB
MTPDAPSAAGHTDRAQPESFRAVSLQASLTVKDLTRSVAWYRDAIGFTIDNEHKRDGKLLGVSLKAGAVRILLTQDDGAKGLDRARGEGFSLQYTTAQNIDALANRIKAAGVTLGSEPADMPWGVRAFRVQDPDGFKLTFSSERS